jgi:predicted alpha/beta-hydrolase family hydrolase
MESWNAIWCAAGAPSAGSARWKISLSYGERSESARRMAPTLETSDVVEIETPHGPACAHLQPVAEPRAALVLGHGAGGGVSAGDLVAAAGAANAAGLSVALVEQPYRVAGRRSPAPAQQLDAAWVAVVDDLRRGALAELPLVAGGRSSGARVACRTAAATGAIGVLCLAFPLEPPSRGAPRTSRLPELTAVTVPVLVVQGRTDRFGMPPASRLRTVVQVAGDHALRSDLGALASAVEAWLRRILS